MADGSWGRYHGPHCRRLAEALAEYHDRPWVTLCSSGTIAVELALRGVGVEPGSEVILAGYDFPGNFRAVEAIGAQAVLVDIRPRSWTIDPDQLDQAASPATRAVLVSHLHGGLAELPTICPWAAARGIAVVEDACQAPGGIVGQRRAGSWGDASVLSFGGSKLLTAGRGGAVLGARPEIHQRIKVFSERGNQAFPLSELQAAVLLPQLARLDERNALRRARAERLLSATANLSSLRALEQPIPAAVPAYYKLAWLYDPPVLEAAPAVELVAALQAEGLPIDLGFRGFARRGPRRCRRLGDLPHSACAGERTLLLHHPALLADELTIDLLAAALGRTLGSGHRP